MAFEVFPGAGPYSPESLVADLNTNFGKTPEVTLTSITDADILAWDNALSVFVNKTPAEIAATLALGDISDVVSTTPSEGEVLTWDDTTSKWINEALPAPTTLLTSLTDTPAGYGTDGQVLATNGTVDGTEWVSVAAAAYPALTANAGKVLAVNGTEDDVEWITVATSSTDMVQTELTGTTHTVDNTDLAGNVVRKLNNAGAITVTVAPSLTGTEPATWIQTGAGAVTFAPGAAVTINSAGGNLTIGAQYGSVTLIPDDTLTDTFYLVGSLIA
jgi:hypothetical protein